MSLALTAKPEPVFLFDEDAHRYTLDGKLLPSITQILDELGYIDKEHFTDEHRYRGTYCHWCFRLINEGTLDRNDVDPQFRGYIDGFDRAITELKIKPIIFEKPMYHPQLLFAGTPDIITEDAIYELKTGQIYPWVAQQTIGQEMLHRAWETRPRRLKRYGLRLNKNGTYDRPVEFKNWQQDETTFRINIAAVRNKLLYGVPMLRGLK